MSRNWYYDDDSVSRLDRAQRWATLAANRHIPTDDSISVGGAFAYIAVGILVGVLIGVWLFLAFPQPPVL